METLALFSKIVMRNLLKKDPKSFENFIFQQKLMSTANSIILLMIVYTIDKEYYIMMTCWQRL
jgi:hypothetical protein